MSKTVMFIHGAWLTPSSWDRFRARFESRGYQTVAPPWPFNDRPVEELRRAPDPGLAKLSVGKPAEQREAYERQIVPTNRSHFLIDSPGWEAVADYAIDWVSEHAAGRNPARLAPKGT